MAQTGVKNLVKIQVNKDINATNVVGISMKKQNTINTDSVYLLLPTSVPDIIDFLEINI